MREARMSRAGSLPGGSLTVAGLQLRLRGGITAVHGGGRHVSKSASERRVEVDAEMESDRRGCGSGMRWSGGNAEL
jgi:hypothetical protein